MKKYLINYRGYHDPWFIPGIKLKLNPNMIGKDYIFGGITENMIVTTGPSYGTVIRKDGRVVESCHYSFWIPISLVGFERNENTRPVSAI